MFETLLYEETDGLAWVTLNRPDVHNAFNLQMQHELKSLWRGLRHERRRALCGAHRRRGAAPSASGSTGQETMGDWDSLDDVRASAAGGTGVGGASSTPWHFDDPGENIGPKSNDLWKPVIAAVNGMACGGAFYILGEVDFVIAADHATFFDPHTTFGMTACFESMHMLQKMPFHEIMRIALLGAKRADVGATSSPDRLCHRGRAARGAARDGRLGRPRDRRRPTDRDPGHRPLALDREGAFADPGPRHRQDPDPARQ